MCGIAGIFMRRGAAPDRAALDRMTDRLVHRGPDARGTHVQGGIGLGHRRLAIVGLSDGLQPMTNAERSVWVTYNGEIYNYPNLKKELEGRGYVFRTHSDTEVLVHGYSAWGEGVVERLRGIFAFAIWDEAKQRLFGARDHLGVKPFYYHATPELFLFGSEPKALLEHPAMPKRPDLEALRIAVQYGYVPAPFAAFDGMRQLEAGSTIVVTTAELTTRRYWTPPELGTGTATDIEAQIDARVDETVELELMSEVPLGAFLSGGIDSSVVAASLAKNPHITQRPQTFCIGFPVPSFDESHHSRAIAENLGLSHQVEIVSSEALGLLDRLVEVYDEPFGDSSAIPTYALCRMARRHVTVALSGDGGDEVFGGYRRYQKLDSYAELPKPARRALGRVSRLLPRRVRGQARLERMSMPLAEQYDREITLFSPPEIRELFSPELHRPAAWSIAELYRQAPGRGPVQKAQWVDLMSYLPGDILTKVDRASMAHALEVRVPLLDHVFVEWAATLPPDQAFGGGRGKVALKEHLGRRVPKALFERPKMGFGVPLSFWLGADGLNGIARGLKAKHPRGQFYAPIRADAVETLTARTGHVDYSSTIWFLLFVEAWWQRHFA